MRALQHRLANLSSAQIAGLVFLTAFILRLIFALQWQDTPYGDTPLMDAADYNQWAKEIAQGHILRETAFYFAPLYPYLLGLLYALFGPHLLLASLVNAVLSATTCALLSLTSLRLFGRTTALATALLTIFDRTFIFYDAPPMKEPLCMVLAATFLYAATSSLETHKRRWFFTAGLALGLAMLTRGNILFLLPAFLALTAWETYRHRLTTHLALKATAIFLLGFLLPIIPCTIHNAIACHCFVPITYADGFNLYLGHSPETDGISYTFPSVIAQNPSPAEQSTTWLAARDLGHQPTPPEVSHYWLQKTFTTIAENPAHELWLITRKLPNIWTNAESFDNYDIDFIRRTFSTTLSLPLFDFWTLALLVPFGIFGMATTRPRQTTQLILFASAYAFSLIIFFVTSRFRLPLLIFLWPLAGAAPASIYSMLQTRHYQRLAAITTIALLSLGLSLEQQSANAKNIDAFDLSVLAQIKSDHGQDIEAAALLHQATTLDTHDTGIALYTNGAEVEQRLGHRQAAEEFLQKGLSVYPEQAGILYEYGRIKAANGDLPAAASLFARATASDPYYLLSYYSEAMVLAKLGHKPEAQKAIAQGLTIAPDNAQLLEARKSLAQ